MNGPLVVVAASARALAECLRRADLPAHGAPLLAVDAFGDDDLLAVVDGWQPLALSDLRRPGRVVAAVEAALHQMPADADGADLRRSAGAGHAATRRADVLLGGGFDGAPDVVRALGSRYRVLNAPPDAWIAARDPLLFRRLGIDAPETQLQPPSDLRGWLRKQAGGSAGLEVLMASAGGSAPGPVGVPGLGPGEDGTAKGSDLAVDHVSVFWQRRIAGMPVSLLFCAHAGGVLPVGINRQWCSPAPGLPYRFGGVASGFDPGAVARGRLIDAAERVTAATGVRGLVSLDAILDRQGCVRALEVNPRPSASVELYDRQASGLLRLHAAAVLVLPLPEWSPAVEDTVRCSHALAVVYASRRTRVGRRPDTAADWRTGTTVEAGSPLCTVHATGPDTRTAMCRARAMSFFTMSDNPS
jgi:hypothetical protein